MMSLMLTGVALAQSTALLTGTVMDPSKAVVPGAQVVCRNTQSGLTYHAVTTPQGLFRFPDLPIGNYEVSVTHQGFEKLVRTGIELLTGHSVDLTLRLRVGEVSQSVQVTEGAPVVQPTSSVVQTTIDSRSMRDLPLNGRNPLQLVTLTPGIAFGGNGGHNIQTANSAIVANGQRPTDNNYELDGASYVDRHLNTAPILPNPDTLQEFTVKSSNFSASQSGAGATVQFSTRSGTNEFHGSAYEFLRNDAMDARNFFSATTTPFKRNQFGATFGGPIIKDKTFFFGSYQGTRARGGANPAITHVPSLAERTGDFSGLAKTIVDPTTGKPFPGNVIPSARFSPLAQKLLPLVPLPNQADGTFVAPPNANENGDQFLVKADHNFSAKDHFSARYFFDEFDFQRTTSTIPGIYGDVRYREQSLLFSDTHTFSPNLLLVGSFSWTRTPRIEVPIQPTTTQALGQKAPSAVANTLPELRVNVNTYFNLFGGGPLHFIPRVFQYRARFTWSHGKHLVQFGMDVQHEHDYSVDTSFASGTNTFNGSRTASPTVKNSGDPFADYMLGLMATFNQSARGPQDMTETKWQPWIQDDWRILPRLTLNLGLRWEPWLPLVDSLGPTGAFVAGRQSALAPDAPTGILFSGDPGIPASVFPNDWNNLAPRVGLAWDVQGNGRTVVRSAYGIFYRTLPTNLLRAANNSAPFRTLPVLILDPPSFDDPYANYPGGTPFPFTQPPVSALKTFHFVRPVTASVLDPHSRTSYTQEWNFTVERQLRRDLGLTASYVGSHSLKVMAEAPVNPAVYRPGATVANTDSRRVYPDIAGLALATPWMFSNYNGLQISVTKRTVAGLSLLGNYTYSKCMDNYSGTTIGADAGGGGGINKFNLNAYYGPCDWDITHRANVSLVYSLPRWSAMHGPAGRLINGWQVTSILSIRGGDHFSATSGRDNSLSGPPNNDLADQISPNTGRPAGANQLDEWFNTSAFTVNALGTFGTAGRNALQGPGAWNIDFGLFKETPIAERLRTEFRFEAFNFFNHANFNNPTANVSNRNFGRILGASAPRVLQLGLKLVF